MILFARTINVDFIRFEVERSSHHFFVSLIEESDDYAFYQYFKGFSYKIVENYSEDYDAQWRYKTDSDGLYLLPLDAFDTKYKHWRYFVFDIPDDEEELLLYFKLKYCSD